MADEFYSLHVLLAGKAITYLDGCNCALCLLANEENQ